MMRFQKLRIRTRKGHKKSVCIVNLDRISGRKSKYAHGKNFAEIDEKTPLTIPIELEKGENSTWGEPTNILRRTS